MNAARRTDYANASSQDCHDARRRTDLRRAQTRGGAFIPARWRGLRTEQALNRTGEMYVQACHAQSDYVLQSCWAGVSISRPRSAAREQLDAGLRWRERPWMRRPTSSSTPAMNGARRRTLDRLRVLVAVGVTATPAASVGRRWLVRGGGPLAPSRQPDPAVERRQADHLG